MKSFLAGVVITILAIGAQSTEGERQLKAAINAELVNGDLKAAIKQYGQIAARFKSDRAVAAMALIHMAECYQKMGDVESQKIYERVVADYADQKDAIALARVQLAAMGGSGRTAQQATKRVWAGDKVDNDGTVSPDGRYLSFTDWAQRGNLAVHDLKFGTDRLLTNTAVDNKKESVFAEESIFSRDNKQIAFNWYDYRSDRYELRLANLNGEPNPRRLLDNASFDWLAPLDWSPDGKWIVAQFSYKDEKPAADQIGLVAVQDGSLRVLNIVGRPYDVRFSPDGEYLAYDRIVAGETGNERGIYILGIDGGAETQIASGSAGNSLIGWSPDGRYLLYVSESTGSSGIWGIPFVNGKAQGQAQLFKADIGRVYSMGLDGAGDLYYYVPAASVLPKIEMATVDFDTGKFLTPPVDVEEGSATESQTVPDWSPDGQFLAYVAFSPVGRRYSIKIRSVATGRVRELRSSTKNLYATWAPDGRSLALVEGNEIFRINAVTGELSDKPLVAARAQSSIGNPVWAPDGKRLYYRLSDSNGIAFVERDLTSGSDREVIRRPMLGGMPLSPDGKYLVTMIEPPPEKKTMLLIPVDGTEPREMMKLDRAGYSLQLLGGWAPDGKSVFARVWAIDNRPGEEEVWQVPIDGGSPRKLNLRLDKHVVRFALQPGGRRVALASGPNAVEAPARPAEVWVLENFLPTAKVVAAK